MGGHRNLIYDSMNCDVIPVLMAQAFNIVTKKDCYRTTLETSKHQKILVDFSRHRIINNNK